MAHARAERHAPAVAAMDAWHREIDVSVPVLQQDRHALMRSITVVLDERPRDAAALYLQVKLSGHLQLPELKRMMREAHAACPRDARLAHELACCFMFEQDYKECLRLLRLAEGLYAAGSPEALRIQYELGKTLEFLGRKDEARARYARYLAGLPKTERRWAEAAYSLAYLQLDAGEAGGAATLSSAQEAEEVRMAAYEPCRVPAKAMAEALLVARDRAAGMKPCQCGKPARHVCARCRVDWYCGVECQRKAWRGGHKAACVEALD